MVPSLHADLEGLPRTYVLDTNVLLYDPNALFVFKEHDLVIPITVIEEIDKFKKDLNETGRNARTVSRHLDKLRAEASLARGAPLAGGGHLRVEFPPGSMSLPAGFGHGTNDNLILQTVLALAQRQGKALVVFVTRDTNMRIKADALGIAAEDYEHAHIEVDEHYTGVTTIDVEPERVAQLYEKGLLPVDAPQHHPNEFVVLRNQENPSNTGMARYDATKQALRLIPRYKEGVWGLFARNKEQLFALDLLLDDSLSLVTLDGVAGTGKTLLAIAAGLRKVGDERKYRRLVVSRPIFPLGRDLGFLPGDVSEKLNPWMKPIFDNLELLLSLHTNEPGRGRTNGPNGSTAVFQPLLDQGILEVEPLTYIRGRSLPQQYLIVDEAQNLTPHEVKTVISRAGEGTKVVLTGDPQQIDNPYVDATSNGLTYVVERFKDSALAGHVTLRKGERSPLAELATQLL